MFSVLVIRLRSLRLLRVSGIVMRLRMFLLLITFLKASHSFRNRSEERFSRNAETELVCRLLLEKKKPRRRSSPAVPEGVRSSRELRVRDHPRATFLFVLFLPRPPSSTLFPYTTLFRSEGCFPFW